MKEIDFSRMSFRQKTMSWSLLKMYLRHIFSRVWKRLITYFLGFGILMLVIDLSGVLRHPFELDYETEFSFPLDLPNFPELIDKYKNKEPIFIEPINTVHTNISYLELADEGCGGQEFRLIILVKSAGANFKKRAAIRATWGNPKRFTDVSIKTVFLLGRVGNPRELTTAFDGKVRPMSYTITAESGKFKDIIVGDFRDTYYNNTLKTMLGMRWLVEICPNFRFAYFVDDDMYVSIKNLLKFARNPAEYPQYWEKLKVVEEKKRELEEKERIAKKGSHILNILNPNDDSRPKPVKQTSRFGNLGLSIDSGIESPKIEVWKNDPDDFDIDLAEDAKLYAGSVFFVPPHRHKIGTKWFVPLSEYAFNYYPPYCPAGSILMSKPTVLDIFYASLFTKLYRFDDVYIGILAKKMGIEPFHNKWFEVWHSSRSYYSDDYKYLITSHEYEPEELRELWFVQKTLGHV